MNFNKTNSDKQRKQIIGMGAILAIMSGCLSSNTTWAQGIVQNPIPSRHGANYVPPSAEQMATLKRIGLLDQSAAASLDAGRFAQAENDARQAMSLGLGSGISQEVLASSLDAQGKSSEALQLYQQMIDQNNSQPRVLLPYALLLLKSGRWAKALEAYNEALPHVGDDDLVRENSQFSTDEPEPQALATAIHIARGLTYNGECSFTGKYQDGKALAEYKQALQLSPSSDLANYYYGYGLQQMGRASDAQQAYAQTLKIAHGSVKLATEQALKTSKKSG